MSIFDKKIKLSLQDYRGFLASQLIKNTKEMASILICTENYNTNKYIEIVTINLFIFGNAIFTGNLSAGADEYIFNKTKGIYLRKYFNDESDEFANELINLIDNRFEQYGSTIEIINNNIVNFIPNIIKIFFEYYPNTNSKTKKDFFDYLSKIHNTYKKIFENTESKIGMSANSSFIINASKFPEIYNMAD